MPGQLDGAELGEVLGDELRVEELEAAGSSRAARCTSATFEASRSAWNMLSPKNAAPSRTP